MNPVFEKQYEVGFNELGSDGKMNPVYFFNWFQNSASTQSHALGIPLTDLISRGLTWVVSRYRIMIFKRPGWRDPVLVRTWRRPQESDFSAPREFEVIAADGFLLAQATSTFKVIEIASKKVVSPCDAIPDYPVLDKKLFQFDTKTVIKADFSEFEKIFTVRRHDLDLNRHVNNVNYVKWSLETVFDSVWDNCQISEIEVIFLKPAFYGDSLIVRTHELKHDPDHEFVHSIQRDNSETDLALVRSVWIKNR